MGNEGLKRGVISTTDTSVIKFQHLLINFTHVDNRLRRATLS